MKNLSLSIIAIVLFTLSSCCFKKDCPDQLPGNEIELYNFEEADLQTITIELFVAKAGDPQPDRTYEVTAYPSGSGDYFICTIPEKIISYYDYHISIGKIQPEVYEVTNLTVDCETCDPCIFNHSTTCTLQGYRVNGKNQEGPSIRIYKGTGL